MSTAAYEPQRVPVAQGGRLAIETQSVNLASEDDLSEHGLVPGEYVRLTVCDTGCGMPREVVARAFEPFFTTKGAERGTRLGLASIYGFVKQSGGNATIYSEPGRATTVNLYLPRFASHEARVSPDAADRVAVSAGEMVLVVEDNPKLRALSLDHLRRLGSRHRSGRRRAAMAVFEGGAKIDLIFSDIVMPRGMTAYEPAVRAREHTPGIKGNRPFVGCHHFPSKALSNGNPVLPLIVVDFVIACVHRGVKGVSVLGIVTVGAVGHTGERGRRLLQGIDALFAAERAQIKRIMDRHGDIFARAGILPPVATTATEILELIEVAATGSAGGFDPRPARLH